MTVRPDEAPAPLVTRRLSLTAMTDNDAGALVPLLQARETNAFLPWFPAETPAAAAALIKERFLSGGDRAYLVRLRDGGEPIGYVHVSGGESRDLGYAVRRDCRNRGFATEACEAVLARLRRDGAPFVTATHDVRNPASGAVMEKLGMTYRYTYRELWQPKNRIVVFRMYQYNFDGSDREYAGYRARYGAWREPTGADGRIGGERARK